MLYNAFVRLLDKWENSAERWEALEDIIASRASQLIDRVLEGLNISFDRALDILRAHNGFITDQERQQRDSLVAAIDNIIDFAVAEECAMVDEMPDELDIENYDIYDDLFDSYNGAGALQENEDVFYAALMAGWWIGVTTETLITFMTMGDERVRPWHEAYEGYSYTKRDFPPELIPPIDWGCRCFLIAEGFASAMGKLTTDTAQIKCNPIFRESLAVGGRIFSEEHPYFKKPLPMEGMQIAKRLKSKFLSP